MGGNGSANRFTCGVSLSFEVWIIAEITEEAIPMLSHLKVSPRVQILSNGSYINGILHIGTFVLSSSSISGWGNFLKEK